MARGATVTKEQIEAFAYAIDKQIVLRISAAFGDALAQNQLNSVPEMFAYELSGILIDKDIIEQPVLADYTEREL